MAATVLSKAAKDVLREVSGRPMDGYTLLARTGLNQQGLGEVAYELTDRSLIKVEGKTQPEAIGEAYFWVPPSAKGEAKFLVESRFCPG